MRSEREEALDRLMDLAHRRGPAFDPEEAADLVKLLEEPPAAAPGEER